MTILCVYITAQDPLYQFVDKSALDDFEKDALRDIFSHFKDLFLDRLPQGLPPFRCIDHKINLVPSAKPVSTGYH